MVEVGTLDTCGPPANWRLKGAFKASAGVNINAQKPTRDYPSGTDWGLTSALKTKKPSCRCCHLLISPLSSCIVHIPYCPDCVSTSRLLLLFGDGPGSDAKLAGTALQSHCTRTALHTALLAAQLIASYTRPHRPSILAAANAPSHDRPSSFDAPSRPPHTTTAPTTRPRSKQGEREGEQDKTMQAPGPSQRSLRRSPGAEPGPPPNVPVRSISPAVGLAGAVQPRASTASSRSNHSNERNSGNPKRPSVSCPPPPRPTHVV